MSTPTSVYRYLDADGVLIYVGVTNRGVQRQAQHAATAEWWPFVRSQDVEHLDTREAALRREKWLIETHRPPFNVQHHPDPANAKAAYLAAKTTAGCRAGTSCQQHMDGWLEGYGVAMKAYPRFYAAYLADLIAQDEGDDLSDAAAAFAQAGWALALQVHVKRGKGLGESIREALPTSTEIEQQRLLADPENYVAPAIPAGTPF